MHFPIYPPRGSFPQPPSNYALTSSSSSSSYSSTSFRPAIPSHFTHTTRSPLISRRSTPPLPIISDFALPAQPKTRTRNQTPWPTPPSSDPLYRDVPSSPNSHSLNSLLRGRPLPVSPIPDPFVIEDLVESCAVEGTMTLRGITPAMMTTWELAHPGVRENESIKYQYDATTQRLIVQCGVSPVHDSLQIFFQNCVFDSVQRRLGRVKFNRIVQVSTGSSYGAFTGECNTASLKQPDAYVHVKGYDFPTVVCEAGFAEKMDDLMSDARLWLMHTGGETTVVVVVAFIEVTDLAVVAAEENEEQQAQPEEEEVRITVEPSRRAKTSGTSATDTAGDKPANPNSDEAGVSSSPASSVLSSVASSNEDDYVELTEESILLATINPQTSHRKLAGDLLDLHLRSRLAKPLLGRIDATVHLFRRNATHTDIEQTFTATLLPVPADGATQSFTLTMGDLLARAADAEGIDPAEEVVFPLDELRDVVEEQIPKMEKMRSMARARAEMKRVDVWEETETFAQMKRGRKRKLREDDHAEVGS